MAQQDDLKRQLHALWQQLGANPLNRALAIARILSHRDEPGLKQLFTELIDRQTPVSRERSEALQLLAPPPEPLSCIHTIVEVAPVNMVLRVDAEVGRLAIALSLAAEFRLWIIGRELTRSDNGCGIISKQALKDRVLASGVRYTPRHYNRLLQRGVGRFWCVKGSTIYLRSVAKVAQKLTDQARERDIPTNGNLPGTREVYLDVSNSLEHWEAVLYAGWLCYRGYKHDITIARATLAQLFNRHENTIRRWEDAHLEHTVSKRRNFAQCPDQERYFEYLPEHAQPYVGRILFQGEVQDIVRLRWQLPNTYHSLIERHQHKGQAAKVRKAVTEEYPADEQRGGHCLRYLASPEKLKRLHRSYKFRVGLLGDSRRPVFVYMGDQKRTKQGIFEITNSGYVFTYPNERIYWTAEREIFWEKRQLRAASMEAWWKEQDGTFL